MDAGIVDDLVVIFRLDLPFSLYFSLLFRKFALETGSNPTASSAKQLGLSGLISW